MITICGVRFKTEFELAFLNMKGPRLLGSVLPQLIETLYASRTPHGLCSDYPYKCINVSTQSTVYLDVVEGASGSL